MSDLLKAHTPDTLRVLLLSSHYRRPIDYGPTRLDEIERGLQTFYRAFERFEELTGRRFDALEAPTRRSEADPKRPLCLPRSPSIARGSSTRWTTTSTPEGPSASCSRSSTPSTASAIQR